MLLIAAIVEVLSETVGRFVFSEEFAKAQQEKAAEAAKECIKQAIPAIPEQSFRRCPKCHLDNDADVKFCKNRGTKLS